MFCPSPLAGEDFLWFTISPRYEAIAAGDWLCPAVSAIMAHVRKTHASSTPCPRRPMPPGRSPARYGNKPDALLEILHDLQHELGLVPEAALPALAKALNLSRAEVHGVVSFYHDFRREPAGRHVVKVCRAESCQSMQGNELAAAAQKSLEGEVRRNHVGWRGHPGSGLLSRQLRPVARHHGRRQAGGPGRRKRSSRRSSRSCRHDQGLCSARFRRPLGRRRRGGRRHCRRGAKKLGIEIVRNGSRGLFWLEPLVEVETAAGRVAYGPVQACRCRLAVRGEFPSRAASTRCRSATSKIIPISRTRSA